MQHNTWYDSARWHKLRQKILRRDKYMCVECKRFGRIKEASEVHHIKHLEDFPELAYDENNLVSLCRACHRKAHPEKVKKIDRNRFKYD